MQPLKFNRAVNKLAFLLLSVALMTRPVISEEIIDDRERGVRPFFLLNENVSPAFWGRPVVSTFFDEVAGEESIADKSRMMSMFYAMASRNESDLYENSQKAPSLAYVIADYEIDAGGFLVGPLKDQLERKWKSTPIFNALQEMETRTSVNGVPDGNNCSIFVSGHQNDKPPSHYVVDSVVVFANSKMNDDDVELCLRNKTAIAFGIAASNFESERKFNPESLHGIYYSLFPTFLELSSMCRSEMENAVLTCVSESLNARYTNLLNAIDSNK